MHVPENSFRRPTTELSALRLEDRPTPRDLTDGELVRAAAERIDGAWEELIARFGGMVWSIAVGQGLTYNDASDVTQATWLNLFNHLDDLRDPERVAGWLKTTATREAIGVHRRRGRATPVDLEQVGHHPTPEPEPDEVVLARYGDPVLRKVFQQLNGGCRHMLLLLSGDPPASYAVIAAEQNISLGTIGSKRKRCLDRLRSLYEARVAEDGETGVGGQQQGVGG